LSNGSENNALLSILLQWQYNTIQMICIANHGAQD